MTLRGRCSGIRSSRWGSCKRAIPTSPGVVPTRRRALPHPTCQRRAIRDQPPARGREATSHAREGVGRDDEPTTRDDQGPALAREGTGRAEQPTAHDNQRPSLVREGTARDDERTARDDQRPAVARQGTGRDNQGTTRDDQGPTIAREGTGRADQRTARDDQGTPTDDAPTSFDAERFATKKATVQQRVFVLVRGQNRADETAFHCET